MGDRFDDRRRAGHATRLWFTCVALLVTSVTAVDGGPVRVPAGLDPIFLPDAVLGARTLPTGQAGARFGSALAISGDTLVVGSRQEDHAGVVNGGAAYVYVRSGGAWVLQQKLVPLDPTPNGEFGSGLALDGDTVIVGAEAPGFSQTGAAYVFVRSGTLWTQEQKLVPSDAAPGDEVGYSVAISGNTAVITGEFASPNGLFDAGAAWVFVRSGGVWTEQQKLVASDAAAGDFFVNAAISGDTILVGADSDDTPAGVGAGSAYVFERTGDLWTEVQKFAAPDGGAGHTFGWSVSMQGDTAVLGAPFASPTATGAVYVFARSGPTWSLQQKLVGSEATPNGHLGWNVSLDADTLVAIADHDNTPAGVDTGAAYVFVRSGSTWTQQQRLVPSDVAVADQLSDAVVAGDRIVLGAGLAELGAAFDAGQVWTFLRSGTTWSQEQSFAAPIVPGGERFGTSVSLSGETVLVGAPAEDVSAGVDGGAAYVFVRSGPVWVEQQKLEPSDAVTQRFFGLAVALSGDTAIVGAPGSTTSNGPTAGAAYVFQRSGTTWVQTQKLEAQAATDPRFGTSVSLSGDTAVIAAAPSVASGAAYVFVKTGSTWTQQQRLVQSDPGQSDAFASSVAVEGDTVFVGSPLDATVPGQPGAGSVDVFTRSGTTWTRVQTLVPADPLDARRFGTSLAVANGTLAVGAPRFDIPGGGATYVFTRSGPAWSQLQKLRASDGSIGNQFGLAVALSAGHLLVGAAADDTPAGPDTGSAYVFARDGAAWLEVQKLLPADAASGDAFGQSVAFAELTGVVGAPFDATANGAGAGSAHVFRAGPADLSLALSASPDPVPGLAPLTYTIDVGNAGSVAATLVTITATPPSGSTFQSASGSGWSCVPAAAGVVTCMRAVLGIGPAPSVTLVVTAPAAIGTVTGVATVTHAGLDPVAANNSASASTVVTQAIADLSLALSDAPDPVRAESVLTYTIDVANLGPSHSSGLTLTDTLPIGVQFASSDPGPPSCVHASGIVTCALGPLPSSGHHGVVIRVTVDPMTLGVLSNTAEVEGQDPDPVALNDSATEATVVVLAPEGELAHGASLQADLASLGGAPDQDVYAIRVEPHTSYEVVVDATSGDIGLAQGPTLERLATDGTSVVQASVAVGVGHSRSLRWMNPTGAPDDQYVRVRSASCGSECAADDVYRIRAWETTGRIPRFNNGGSQVTVLLLHNAAPSPVGGRILFWATSGVLLHEQAFDLPSQAAFTLNTAALAPLQGQSGSITVSHDGPHGALAGKAVAVEPATGLAFDSPLEPRIR